MDPMRISLSTPTYNERENLTLLAEEIFAIVGAEPDIDLELIVVDDGSSDGSADVVASLKDSRVRVLKSGFEGIATALNIGVKAATAPFIGRMDVDDIASPYRLEWQVDALRRGQADIVGSRVRIVDLEGNAVASMQRYERWINDHCTWQDISGLRFVESPLVHPSVTARREVFELGYRNGHFPEDYDLWLRITAALPTLHIAEPLVKKYGGHSDQLSRSRWGMDRYRIQSLEKLLAAKTLTTMQERQALEELTRKIDIYLTGARRRQRQNEIAIYACKEIFYRRLLASSSFLVTTEAVRTEEAKMCV